MQLLHLVGFISLLSMMHGTTNIKSDMLVCAHELYQSPVKWISFQIKNRFQMLIALLHQMTGTKMEEDPNISCQ